MSIINCPECGHVVSDKAVTCPNCGVRMADVLPQPADTTGQEPAPNPQKPEKKKGRKAVLLTSFLLSVLICAAGLYMYQDAKDAKENDEYEYAMKSSEPSVLQSYLDIYKDAPKAHRDSIEAHLRMLESSDKEWRDAVVSGTLAAIEEYMRKYPNSLHRQEALERIDSLFWRQCAKADTEEAYKEYLEKHYDGVYYEEATAAMKRLKASNVSDSEKAMLNDLFRKFFISINTRDEERLVSTVADNITLLDKEGATKDDVLTFMHKQYKDGVKNLVWKIDKNYDISKREVGDALYEYSVSFTASKETETTGGDKSESLFRINATVSPDNRISRLTMKKQSQADKG